MEKISYMLAVGAVLIAAIGQVLLKSSANLEHNSFIRKFLNIRVILSYGLMFVSLTMNTIALRYIPLKMIPSITATSFLWILLLSYFCLKEKPDRYKLIGTGIIMAGVIISGMN